VNYLGAGRGNQDERPVRVGATDELGRTIIHLEGGRHFTVGFTGEKWVV
jgi:hypothetical protein